MNNKKILSLVMSLCVLGTSSMLFTSNVKAVANDKAVPVVTTNKGEETPPIQRIAGVVRVTAKSGANVRSGPGTNYSKKGTANYGAELQYAGQSKNGWYKIMYRGGYAWISSSVARLS
ncbi:SH3 domain-containing protein [Clostridium sporogenes]|uniref:SH3 domain-containing protein n=1 Tax=Clostridium sporogenes TaxID=1509 RepID=UPI002238DE4D|nr:SH3 domain-containing protein [Clostridium sporogenes]MCW6094562.1 SH3 domain-containing protein [Clostridium sporogenes]